MNKLKNMIEISHLSRSFGRVKAVNDLSFRVKRGESRKRTSSIHFYGKSGIIKQKGEDEVIL